MLSALALASIPNIVLAYPSPCSLNAPGAPGTQWWADSGDCTEDLTVRVAVSVIGGMDGSDQMVETPLSTPVEKNFVYRRGNRQCFHSPIFQTPTAITQPEACAFDPQGVRWYVEEGGMWYLQATTSLDDKGWFMSDRAVDTTTPYLQAPGAPGTQWWADYGDCTEDLMVKVAVSNTGKIDGIDQLSETPLSTPVEKNFVYQRGDQCFHSPIFQTPDPTNLGAFEPQETNWYVEEGGVWYLQATTPLDAKGWLMSDRNVDTTTPYGMLMKSENG